MMYAFLMLGMTLLGGLVRLMHALRLSVPLPVLIPLSVPMHVPALLSVLILLSAPVPLSARPSPAYSLFLLNSN